MERYSLYVNEAWISNFNSEEGIETLQKKYEDIYPGERVCVWDNVD